MKHRLFLCLVFIGVSLSSFKKEEVKQINVGVVTYGGYAGGMHYNGGFLASEKSKYFTDHNLLVNFERIDDFVASRKMFEKGELDLLWMTFGAYATEYSGLKSLNPKIVFASSFSRGADVIVARRGINEPKDLIGKTIAIPEMTPSHTLFLAFLEKNNISVSDVKVENYIDAIGAASAFKAGQVDAAIVWSPDDEACVKVIRGSSVLTSSKDFPYTIIDGLIAKASFIEENKNELTHLFKGWTESAKLIKNDKTAKKEIVKILEEEFMGFDEAMIHQAIDNVHLCTLADNQMIFGLTTKKEGEQNGKDIFNKFAKKYHELGYLEEIPQWKDVVDKSIVEAIK